MRKSISVVATLGTALTTLLALAAPASAATVVAIPMPDCCAADTIELGASVYSLVQQPPGPNPERPTLVRIDPASNVVTGSVDMPNGTSAGNALDTSALATAAGSIWVIAYFEDEVLRVDPGSMTITATVSVGRSPSSIVSDGSSLWVALNNQKSVVRIDPASNAVAQTIPVGSSNTADSPWQLAYDGTQLLASMPTSGRVARINPRSGAVRYDRVGFDAAACAHLLPVPGGYWLDDTECSPAYFRWDAGLGEITAVVDPTTRVRHDWGAVIVNNALYTGEFRCTRVCTHGYLVKRDIDTGAEITLRNVGTETDLPHFADGSFWVGNFQDATLQRVANF